MDGFESLESEMLNSERLRRMKRLMNEMHRAEFEAKKLHLPPIKSRALIVAMSFISVLIFGVTTLYNFNRFVTLEERVLSARGHVEDVLQRRKNLFANLVNVALNHAALEQEVYRYVATTRKDVGREGDSEAKPPPEPVEAEPKRADPKTQSMLANMLGINPEGGGAPLAKLLAIVEQYPNITASVTYQQLMDKMVEMENRISMRRDEYNEEVRIYNTLISSFPWYILAKVTSFERYDYFAVRTDHPESTFFVPKASPEIFKRLLPSETGAAMQSNPAPRPAAGADKGATP
ncbi:magnetosome protein MamQ [Magnetofaba australis]|nr:magnetosome protein MamQ [Magnetofaba australis]